MYIYLGKIVNTHGIKGEIRILSDFDYKDIVFKKDFKIYIGKDKQEETINTYRVHKNYDMILTGTNIGLSPNLTTYFGDGNYSKFSNEELRNILTEIQSISDENLLKEKYNKIYDIYKNQMPFISLYFNKNVLCYSPELMGDIKPNCFNLFYNVRNWYRQY